MTININHKEKWILPGIIALCFLLISLLSFKRTYFEFGTETDYLGGFLPEARRIINGEPLLLDFHPPLYSMILALVQALTQDWLRTGLLVSLIASIISLTANFLFFYYLLGAYAGWGALLGLITSDNFLEYSAYATSDIFFLALYSSALLLSLLATKRRFAYLWLLSGLAVGCLLLTRTNGIVCLFIATLPWWSKSSFQERFKSFIWFSFGLSIPLLFWVSYAFFSDSQLVPTGNYANFALTYFSPSDDRVSGDSRVQVEAKFDSLTSVLFYDPAHLVKTYIKDLTRLGGKMITMLQHPLNIFIPIGIFSFFKSKIRNQKLCVFYIVLTLLQVLLINFKAYEDRYFLFLLPILGVAVGESFRYLISLAQGRRLKKLLIGFCAFCVLSALIFSYVTSWKSVDSDTAELREVVLKAQELKISESSIVDRKPHLSFYTNSTAMSFPDVKTLPELRCSLEAELKSKGMSKDLFLYYGTQARIFRRQFEELSNPLTSPDWLQTVAQSTEPNLWVLYKYNTSALSSNLEFCKTQD